MLLCLLARQFLFVHTIRMNGLENNYGTKCSPMVVFFFNKEYNNKYDKTFDYEFR